MRIAIIPARGGSKRIPRKNIKLFCGKPIIAYSIETALSSGCFEHVVVSTDDEEIAETARAYGAETPFLRPAELSDDLTGTTPVIKHAIEWFQQRSVQLEQICCIYATAPFVQATDLQAGLDELLKYHCNYVFAVTSYPFPIQRAIRISDRGRVSMFNPEHFSSRSQDLEDAWHDSGQFYWGSADAWSEEAVIFGENSMAVKLPRHRVQDIDTAEDWIRAEWLFRAMSAQACE